MPTPKKKEKALPSLSIEEIQDNIKLAYDYSRNNHKYFKATKKFVSDVSLTVADQKNLQTQEKNQLTFNILEPIVDQNLRNIRDGYPEANYEAKDDSQDKQMQAERLNIKLDEIYEDSNYEHATYGVAANALVGNEGIFKLKTEYLNDFTFDQTIRIGSVDDPTNILFDPYAKEITKCDASNVTELTYLSKDAFKRLYPNVDLQKLTTDTEAFPWKQTDTDTKKEIYTVATYWHKQIETITLYQLENGSVTDRLPKGEKPVETRKIEKSRVYTIRLFSDNVLENWKPTVWTRPPFIDVPGKVVMTDKGVKYLSYLHNAIDAQRAKNFMAQEFLDRSLNAWNSMILIPEESLASDTIEDLRDPTQRRIIKYKAYYTDEMGQTQQLPPPEVRPPEPVSQEHLAFFNNLDDTIQKILGTYSASLDQQDLSGKALYNLSAYINAANEPFMFHLELAAVQVAQLILEAMPELFSTEQFEQQLPNGNKVMMNESFEFHPQEFIVKPMRNVNTRLQREATVERVTELAQTAPPFAQFLFTQGLPRLLSMMDLKDSDEWVNEYEMFVQQQQNKPPMPNPQMITAQAKMMDSQNDAARIQLDQQKLSADISQNNLQAATDLHQQHEETKRTEINAAANLNDTRHQSLRHVLTTLHNTVSGGMNNADT